MTANPEIIALREEVRPYSITMRRIDSGLEILGFLNFLGFPIGVI